MRSVHAARKAAATAMGFLVQTSVFHLCKSVAIDPTVLRNLRLSLARCAIQRISVMSRLRLGTSSLRKVAWRCFFTIGKLKQASSAISWLLRPSHTSCATSCSRLVSWTKCGKREVAGLERGAAEERNSSHSIRKCGRATPAELTCFRWTVARKCGDRG